MKKLVLILFLSVSAPFFAQKTYDAQWKQIKENEHKGLYKSNLPLILEIEKQAAKENNMIQLIKALKAEFSIINQTQDDTQNDTSSRFFAKVKHTEQNLKGEEKLVFQVLSREFINDYYERNRWKINGITNVNSGDLAQIETWSKLDFKNYLVKHFRDLGALDAELKKIPMHKYKSLFTYTQDLEYFPTLLEWKTMKEIQFRNNGNLFTPNEKKAAYSEIIKKYDQLIAENNGNTQLYFEHQKLNFVCETANCKDRPAKLKNLYNSATQGDYKVMLVSEMMDILVSQKKNNEALEWAQTARKAFPNSLFLINVKNKESQIINPSISIGYETHTQANKPIHISADAKNAKQFSINIYAVKSDIENFLKYTTNQHKKYFESVKKTLVRKENFEIPETKDYLNHRTSFEIQPLPSGIYMAEYLVNGAVQGEFYFIATNSRILYTHKNESNLSENKLLLVDRENGALLPSQELKWYEYTAGTSATDYKGTTDKNAQFQFPESAETRYYRYYLVQQPKTNDFNLIQAYGNDGYREIEATERNQVQIFLDRVIYRPGQSVYFKAINTRLSKQKESAASGISQKISLYDANGELLSSQTFTTNTFGSYNGSFILPKGKLNGQFSLRVENEKYSGYKDFRVEEYKRPKFEVILDPLKEEYKYGQTIELKGKAVMFSGVPLSNATVNYEIKKRNIRWMYFWWYPRGNGNENSILGQAKTNEKGEFSIKIYLKKDETLEGIQVDNYEIQASVTDINGETQSATDNIKVATVSHYIKTGDIADTFTDKEVAIKVETKNYNDQNLKKSYHAKLSKMLPSERVFRNNFENAVQDLPKYSKTEFVGKFPHDYFSIKEKESAVEKVILDRKQDDAELNLGKLPAGKYRLELYNIEGNDTIKAEKDFEVFDKRFLTDSQKPFLRAVPEKAEYKRNEKAKIFIYSAIPNAFVHLFVQNGDGKTRTEERTLKNGVLEYETGLPQDEDFSQLNIQVQLAAYNDVRTENINLKISSDKKPLRIETVTFRDKLLPGSKEKWTVKILGDDKEKINAEVLANMYDKSLDQFAENTYTWQPMFQPSYRIVSYEIWQVLAQEYYSKRLNYSDGKNVMFPSFNWFDGGIVYTETPRITKQNESVVIRGLAPMAAAKEASMNDVVSVGYVQQNRESLTGSSDASSKQSNATEDVKKVTVRQNLNETAFFYPELKTDNDGNVSFEFTSPEALTQWKLMFLAHTADARAAVLEKEVVTQKEFSVTPNYPRFLREGDEINLQSKLSSLTSQKLNGSATLQILDAFTNEDITEKFGLSKITAVSGLNREQAFSLNENGSAALTWKLKVPQNISSIIIKIVAKAGQYSDGEQQAIAILPNRMLVTEAVPVFVKEGQTKTFILNHLAQNTSSTVSNVATTLELTTNPIWEVMFALPSLKEDQHHSADVIFNKWFADVLAAEIFKANPKLKTVFDEYQSKGLLQSNLEKNQELKQLLLEETPWILDSKNEAEQMQKVARLFDANTMRNSLQSDWAELAKLQNPDGGFSWHSGYPSSYYTSLYILKNLGRINGWLKGKTADYQNAEQKLLVNKLVSYVDGKVAENADRNKEERWSNWVLDYLDTRHYWESQYPLKGYGLKLKNSVIQQAPKAEIQDFTFFGLHRSAMLFDQYGLKNVSKKLLTYLKETATQSETQGIYWKQNLNGWGWYNTKTENHAGAMEAFQKLTPNDTAFIEELKIWLITQKEVNRWSTSRATAEVIFTILNSGKSWTGSSSDRTDIIWGGKTLNNADSHAAGYVKSAVNSDQINKNLATVTITKPGAGIVQGGLFWQYYEDLDKIKSTETTIAITKELYKKVKTANGEELQKITAQSPLKIGDRVTVRMILNSDRNMEYVHLKDMRAAGFEPLNTLSGYQWKNNLGYYQSTKDASTNFYIEYLPKGKYVFEYDYICNAAGTFSNGITTLQNYYAPQMNAHTQGNSVNIDE